MCIHTHGNCGGKGTKKIPHMQAYGENFAIFLYFAGKTIYNQENYKEK
jgi:hypothetical protein